MSRKGGTVCVVRGCSSRTLENTSLFRFPKDPERASSWLRLCNREDLLDKSVDALHRNYKVCEKHFDNKFISHGGTRKHLFQLAVPSIFPHNAKHSLKNIHDDSKEPPEKIAVMPDDIIGAPIVSQVETIIFPQAASNISGPEQSLEPIPVSSTPSSCKFFSSTSTQTPIFLSSGSPRKLKLHEKLSVMRRKKCMETSCHGERDWTLEDFNEMCDKFLGEPLSGIVKEHAKLKQESFL